MANFSINREQYKQVNQKVILWQASGFLVLAILSFIFFVIFLLIGAISDSSALQNAYEALGALCIWLIVYVLYYAIRLKMTMNDFDDRHSSGVAFYSIELSEENIVKIAEDNGNVHLIKCDEIEKIWQYKDCKIIRTMRRNIPVVLNAETDAVLSAIDKIIGK